MEVELETPNKAPTLLNRMETFWNEDDRTVDVAVGRDIGFDFARMGIRLPADSPRSVMEGYSEGMFVYNRHQEASTKYERKLVRLRLSAFKRNRVVDSMVTPRFLELIEVKHCPITRILLTSGTNSETDATVDRVFNGGAYAIGNIAVMSKKANQAKGAMMPMELLEIANSGASFEGLSTVEWRRLACLCALAAPPGYPQTHMPLYVYPPNGILLSNGFTLIQVCVSAVAAGFLPQRWEAEMRRVLDGKLSKRRFDALMESIIGQTSQRLKGVSMQEMLWFGICDCWMNELVFDRYTKFMGSLTKSELKSLVTVASRSQQSLRTVKQFSDESLDAWALDTKGYR